MQPEVDDYVNPEDRVSGEEEVYFDEKDDEIFVIDSATTEDIST